MKTIQKAKLLLLWGALLVGGVVTATAKGIERAEATNDYFIKMYGQKQARCMYLAEGAGWDDMVGSHRKMILNDNFNMDKMNGFKQYADGQSKILYIASLAHTEKQGYQLAYNAYCTDFDKKYQFNYPYP